MAVSSGSLKNETSGRYSLILLAAAGDTLQPWGHLRAYSYAKGLELLGVEFVVFRLLFLLWACPLARSNDCVTKEVRR